MGALRDTEEANGYSMSRFDTKTALLLGLGFLGITVIGPIFNTFVPIFLRDAGLSAGVVGFVMTWDNYINLLLQPMVGARSDQTWTRIGRRKPWIVAGAPIAVLFFACIPAMGSLAGIMVAILVTNLALSLFRSPAVALLGDLFPESHQSRANGVINLLGGIGAICAFLAGRALYQFGRGVPFLFGSIVMAAMMMVVLFFVHEPAARATEEKPVHFSAALKRLRSPAGRGTARLLAAIASWTIGYSALEAWASSFGKYELGVREDVVSGLMASLAVAFVVAALPCGLLAERFGKTRFCLYGAGGLTLLFALGVLIHSPATFVAFLIPAGVLWAMITVNSLPLLFDVGQWADKGTLTGLYYLSGSLALISGPIAVGALVDLTSSYRVLFVFSALFMAAATFLIAGVRADKSTDSVAPAA